MPNKWPVSVRVRSEHPRKMLTGNLAALTGPPEPLGRIPRRAERLNEVRELRHLNDHSSCSSFGPPPSGLPCRSSCSLSGGARRPQLRSASLRGCLMRSTAGGSPFFLRNRLIQFHANPLRLSIHDCPIFRREVPGQVAERSVTHRLPLVSDSRTLSRRNSPKC